MKLKSKDKRDASFLDASLILSRGPFKVASAEILRSARICSECQTALFVLAFIPNYLAFSLCSDTYPSLTCRMPDAPSCSSQLHSTASKSPSPLPVIFSKRPTLALGHRAAMLCRKSPSTPPQCEQKGRTSLPDKFVFIDP